jgi:hypothetical protein
MTDFGYSNNPMDGRQQTETKRTGGRKRSVPLSPDESNGYQQSDRNQDVEFENNDSNGEQQYQETSENVLTYPNKTPQKNKGFHFYDPTKELVSEWKHNKKDKYHFKIDNEKKKHLKWKERFYAMKEEYKVLQEQANNINNESHIFDSFGREIHKN